jgi:hypothetical protein
MADLRQYTRVYIMRQVAQLDELYAEQHAAWERSKGEKTRRRHRRVDGVAGPGKGPSTIVEVEATSRDGDPRFTAQMLLVLKAKCALLEGRVWPPAQPPDPFEQVRGQLKRLSDDELVELAKFNDAQLMNPQLKDVTPEQLEKWPR